MKKYKTWEMIKELTENPEKEFKRVGDELKVSLDTDNSLLWKSGHAPFNINHVWEEVMAKIYELELYKLIKEGEYVSEVGWINDDSFCVWISYMDLDDFIEKAIEIFGYGIFDDGGFDANMQDDGVCIDLCEMLSGYIDVEDVFPKEEYK